MSQVDVFDWLQAQRRRSPRYFTTREVADAVGLGMLQARRALVSLARYGYLDYVWFGDLRTMCLRYRARRRRGGGGKP